MYQLVNGKLDPKVSLRSVVRFLKEIQAISMIIKVGITAEFNRNTSQNKTILCLKESSKAKVYTTEITFKEESYKEERFSGQSMSCK